MTESTALELAIHGSGAFRCLECGKCTAVCPVSQYDRRFSPRRTVGRAILRRDQALLADDRLWACLTCLRCSQVCPVAVSYSDLTLSIRTAAHERGQAAVCTHGEVIHAWMRLMMNPDLQQNRLGWLEGAAAGEGSSGPLRVSSDSDTLYFVGCAPYYDVQFRGIGVDGNGVARATVQALNALGVEPRVLAEERCCGHDLLWEGDREGFARLAELNAELIHATGVSRVVTACPECARTLAVDYPAHGFAMGVEVVHLAELAAEVLGNGRLDSGGDGETPGDSGASADVLGVLAPEVAPPQPAAGGDGRAPRRVTFHDPCRLGRHQGVYDAPRRLLEAAGLELVEMPRYRENAQCCGTNGWTHCGAANKQIQAERLREAQATGAEVLVTACLKCQIHFKCALEDRQLGEVIQIQIQDLATVLAEALTRKTRPEGAGS